MSNQDQLIAELTKMRRHPDEFSFTTANCRWCHPVKEGAFSLSHANATEAGLWCPNHGWLHFQSIEIPPDESMPKLRKGGAR